MSNEKKSEKIVSRDFKGIWIPKEIWLHKGISIDEKVLLAEIHSLDGKDGCFASNAYFMEFFNWEEKTVKRRLSKLKSLGFIFTEKFDGRTRILRSNLFPKNKGDVPAEGTNLTPQGGQKCHPSPIGDFIEPERKEESKDSSSEDEDQYPPEVRKELDYRFKKSPLSQDSRCGKARRKAWDKTVYENDIKPLMKLKAEEEAKLRSKCAAICKDFLTNPSKYREYIAELNPHPEGIELIGTNGMTTILKAKDLDYDLKYILAD